MATAKLENTRMTFSTGGTVLARMTATADTVTFVGDGGSNEVTLTNVKTPVTSTDAATKGYVDSLVVSGVTWKNSANVATVSGNMLGSTYDSGTNTITWDGVLTIDGVVIASGDRIVVKDQAVTTGTNSTGIYEFTSTAPFNNSPSVTTPGTGYTGASGVATTSSGSGTGMIVTTTDDGFGGLSSITITNQGTNYLNGDIITVTGGTGGTFILSSGSLVITRTADAAATDISNGSAIFVFAGTVNNDKSFVTTNDTSTTWGGGVTFSVMATAPPTAGSNTQIQYNNNNSFGASPNFTYNSGSNTLGLSGAVSTIAGSATLNVTSSNIGIYGSSVVSVGQSGGDSWSFASGGLISSNSGFGTIDGGYTLTLMGINDVIIDTPTNDWTFNGIILSSEGAFTARAAVGSSVALFDTTTSGTINIGNTAAGTGTITISGSTAAINVGSATTGEIAINNAAAMTLAANSTSITVGSSNSTTTTLNGLTTNVGTTSTTALNLFARGTSGAAVLTAGAGGTSGAGGAITLTAGAGGVTTGNGGSITITAGSTTVSSGGNITLVPGSGSSASTSGNVIFRLANAGTSTATNNIIEFENSVGTQIGRIENTGDMYAATFSTTSDIKYKTNIEQLSDPLNQLKKIEGYSFNWKEDFAGYNDRLQYGVVAQQIEEAGLCHLVTGNGSSKSVNYIGLIPLLIEAVKELSAKLEKQAN